MNTTIEMPTTADGASAPVPVRLTPSSNQKGSGQSTRGRRRNRDWLLPLFSLGALAFAAWSVVHLRDVREPAAPLSAPSSAGSVEATVSGVGLIEPNTESIALSVPVAGWVTQVFARAGEKVAAGQALFRLDDRDLQAELGVRRANVAATVARVEITEADLRDAELLNESAARLDQRRVISPEEGKRKKIAVDASRARLSEARAAVSVAEAQLRQSEVDLERLTITSPLACTVLQSDVRPGQYAPSGPLTKPLMLLGNVDPMHVRVEIDEQDAHRVRPGATAVAVPRGDSARRIPLEFLRLEPYVLPKSSLTGAASERTDTRVLQAIYRVEGMDAGGSSDGASSIYIGQQVDVFIAEARGSGR